MAVAGAGLAWGRGQSSGVGAGAVGWVRVPFSHYIFALLAPSTVSRQGGMYRGSCRLLNPTLAPASQTACALQPKQQKALPTSPLLSLAPSSESTRGVQEFHTASSFRQMFSVKLIANIPPRPSHSHKTAAGDRAPRGSRTSRGWGWGWGWGWGRGWPPPCSSERRQRGTAAGARNFCQTLVSSRCFLASA